MDQIRRKVVEYAVKATTGGQGLDKVLGLVQSAVASGAGSVPDIGKLLAGANLPSLDTDTLMQLVTQAVQSAAPLLAGLRATGAHPTAAGARHRPASPPVQTSRQSMPSVLGGPRQPAVEVVHAPALAEERAGVTKPSSKSTTKAAPKPKATSRKATIKAPTFVKAKAPAAPRAKPKAH